MAAGGSWPSPLNSPNWRKACGTAENEGLVQGVGVVVDSAAASVAATTEMEVEEEEVGEEEGEDMVGEEVVKKGTLARRSIIKHFTFVLELLLFYSSVRNWVGLYFFHCVFEELSFTGKLISQTSCRQNKLIALQLFIQTAVFKPIHLNVNPIKVVLIHLHCWFCLYFTSCNRSVHLQAKWGFSPQVIS